ncbi:hypothetical protein [Dactylosporangium salmoneum]|uniref:Uncharacterized protein n=1 Tax=Dactylosporangium salmoneum TaxID=53361 RepID=A0ABN3HY65_9ACTN
MVAAAALVAAASLAPWFRTRFASGDGWETNTASAWQASTRWSVAVALCLAAAVLSLASANRHVRRGCAAACVAALGLTVWQWLAIGPLDTSGGLGWSAAESSSSPGVGDIVRDQLVVVHLDGLTQDVGWGLYAGSAAMAMLVLAILAAPSGHRGQL